MPLAKCTDGRADTVAETPVVDEGSATAGSQCSPSVAPQPTPPSVAPCSGPVSQLASQPVTLSRRQSPSSLSQSARRAASSLVRIQWKLSVDTDPCSSGGSSPLLLLSSTSAGSGSRPGSRSGSARPRPRLMRRLMLRIPLRSLFEAVTAGDGVRAAAAPE